MPRPADSVTSEKYARFSGEDYYVHRHRWEAEDFTVMLFGCLSKDVMESERKSAEARFAAHEEHERLKAMFA